MAVVIGHVGGAWSGCIWGWAASRQGKESVEIGFANLRELEQEGSIEVVILGLATMYREDLVNAGIDGFSGFSFPIPERLAVSGCLVLARIPGGPWERLGVVSAEVAINARRNLHARPSVVLIGHDAHPHGAQLILLSLARSLSSHWQVNILLEETGSLAAEYARCASTWLVKERSPYAVAMSVFRPDAILVNSAASLRPLLGDSPAVPAVVLIHEMPGAIRELGLSEQLSGFLASISAVVFPCETARAAFAAAFCVSAEGMRVMPQGVSKHAIFSESDRWIVRRGLRLSETVKIILNVGNQHPCKGYDRFALAARLARGMGLPWIFVWVGHHPHINSGRPRTQGMIPHDLDSGVLLVGRMENPSRWYSAADVMYHSSLEDTFPTVVLEAVESGLPVIAHEGAGGAAEIISQIGIGTVLKGNSNLDTIAAIATVQMDSGSRIVNAQRGKRLIAERFSESGYAAGIREIVEGAIGKGCGSWASHD